MLATCWVLCLRIELRTITIIERTCNVRLKWNLFCDEWTCVQFTCFNRRDCGLPRCHDRSVKYRFSTICVIIELIIVL